MWGRGGGHKAAPILEEFLCVHVCVCVCVCVCGWGVGWGGGEGGCKPASPSGEWTACTGDGLGRNQARHSSGPQDHPAAMNSRQWEDGNVASRGRATLVMQDEPGR